LNERIAVLLSLANVPPDEFERQVEQAAETFTRREHWTRGPAAGGAGRRIDAGTAGAVLTGGVVPAAGPAPPAPPGAPATMICPSCAAGLAKAPYEGLDVVVCPACGGRLVSTAGVGKLLARREVAFSDEQRRLADWLTSGGDHLRRAALAARGRHDVPLVPCPRCAAPMMRRHYSYEHAVEIDYCSLCDLFWFESDELEALQLLVERQAG
jgi:Zn-finger nucleic acid-binding protein